MILVIRTAEDLARLAYAARPDRNGAGEAIPWPDLAHETRAAIRSSCLAMLLRVAAGGVPAEYRLESGLPPDADREACLREVCAQVAELAEEAARIASQPQRGLI